jgi:thiosulfate/3-mercaptopyruvate sulfurtransferase
MMDYSRRDAVKACAATLATLLCPVLRAQTATVRAEPPASAILQPEELVQVLGSAGQEKPLILQVGSRVLYGEAHIPAAEYAGAAGQEAGLQALEERAKGLSRDRFIVLYCGCCPWIKCPNIRAAYQKMQALGFTRVKVLYIATDFGTDWVNKGYPVAKGR